MVRGPKKVEATNTDAASLIRVTVSSNVRNAEDNTSNSGHQTDEIRVFIPSTIAVAVTLNSLPLA